MLTRIRDGRARRMMRNEDGLEEIRTKKDPENGRKINTNYLASAFSLH